MLGLFVDIFSLVKVFFVIFVVLSVCLLALIIIGGVVELSICTVNPQRHDGESLNSLPVFERQERTKEKYK